MSKEKIKKEKKIDFLKLVDNISYNNKKVIDKKNSFQKIGWNTPVKAEGNPQDIVNEIVNLIESNYNKFGTWGNAFDYILDLILYTLTNQEEKYLSVAKEINKDAILVIPKIFGLLLDAFCNKYLIYDYLGQVYMRIAYKSKQEYFGQYFTPFNLATLLATILIPDPKKVIEDAIIRGKKIMLNEPAMGSGVLFLAIKKIVIETIGLAGLDNFQFIGQDIDGVT